MTSQARSQRIAFVLLIILVLGLAGLWMLGQSDRTSKPMPPNGDTLGPAYDESWEHYRARADASFVTAQDEAPNQNAWSMVVFQPALLAQDVSDITAPLNRVSAVISGAEAAREIPEPTDGHSRADVFLSNGLGNEDHPISAVIVWDTPTALAALKSDARVASVEILPPDASWGRFGIRPPLWTNQSAEVSSSAGAEVNPEGR
ncbi:hypothetical protein GSS88_10080 [Corynebacterium sp. 3HC-13]|uniref:hypothetical protein n=1 Tax=Corynebacterium poyangense TaxID=2684405 RepID=UPI001CCF244D|nr:hypothetical protein [Corynebacterium poyangense]MBZ8178129.1 hypothetical protein [Corynebacterium poyangense]